MSITQARLKELLDYDPSTGVFTWRRRSDVLPRWNTRYAGTRAGTNWKGRYRQVGVGGRIYLEHRLAWFWVIGLWPKEIDHVDCDGLNNRWDNLRTCTHSENQGNARARISAAGLKGVGRSGNKYTARIRGGYLGTFETKESAHDAYVQAARRVFGAFARAE